MNQHKGLRLGRLEVLLWRDTGKPKFRLWYSYAPPVTKTEWAFGRRRAYVWIVKVMSYWTLWIAWKSKNHA
jgi:hypothetical protein